MVLLGQIEAVQVILACSYVGVACIGGPAGPKLQSILCNRNCSTPRVRPEWALGECSGCCIAHLRVPGFAASD